MDPHATIRTVEWVESIELDTTDPFGHRVKRVIPCRSFRVEVDIESGKGRMDAHPVIVPVAALHSRRAIYELQVGDHAAAFEAVIREVLFSWHQDQLQPEGEEHRHLYGGQHSRCRVEWHPSFDHAGLEEHRDRIASQRVFFDPEPPAPAELVEPPAGGDEPQV